jgi:uncharacterized membrane protein YtjA (UPF0391 family)
MLRLCFEYIDDGHNSLGVNRRSTPGVERLGFQSNRTSLLTLEGTMLSWAITFLVVAIIAGVLGLSGVAGTATNIAYILFVIFVILAIVGFVSGRKPVA